MKYIRLKNNGEYYKDDLSAVFWATYLILMSLLAPIIQGKAGFLGILLTRSIIF
jgi:hypothetical protein